MSTRFILFAASVLAVASFTGCSTRYSNVYSFKKNSFTPPAPKAVDIKPPPDANGGPLSGTTPPPPTGIPGIPAPGTPTAPPPGGTGIPGLDPAPAPAPAPPTTPPTTPPPTN
jgi:hypothetical protein